ncbi:hypothetical protein Cadr_000030187 [Camelus dromedarius]|uniref:Uncharacterized protein n=1 Tax=Camelus dromedarius TaxID=9838 RepID=A0A5N4C027_CAMDR|nr:hypothetical protein Cadr_000030187 [Camelus dromedarius]
MKPRFPTVFIAAGHTLVTPTRALWVPARSRSSRGSGALGSPDGEVARHHPRPPPPCVSVEPEGGAGMGRREDSVLACRSNRSSTNTQNARNTELAGAQLPRDIHPGATVAPSGSCFPHPQQQFQVEKNASSPLTSKDRLIQHAHAHAHAHTHTHTHTH